MLTAVSRFARSTTPKIVYEELLLTTCINFLPVELKMEILSYLHMGIILSLYEQPKDIILYCIKMERMDRRLGFPSVLFSEYSEKELIKIILFTDTINKKYIMRHFINFKKREIVKQKRKQIELEQQQVQFQLLESNDYFLNKTNYRNYLIIRKTNCGFRAIKITLYQNKVLVPLNPKIVSVKMTSICTRISLPNNFNSFLDKLDILNKSNDITINDLENPLKKEDVVEFILAELYK